MLRHAQKLQSTDEVKEHKSQKAVRMSPRVTVQW